MTYPREVWYLRVGLFLVNLLERLRGDPFRSFLHPVREMDALLRDRGMNRVFLKRLFVWEVAVYTRVGGAGDDSLAT